ncbi:GNAT family N-acetyltransferase [Sporosarcina beigongshangi]|uniref:GNAT family N-acetyltransferase n=1 Tax=Sporosarcina beigongshangi TaxID=2782538 RepID=UPI0019394FAE|nr:GNAT family N-acetyltransferase [Sporosarcina beigongshangi]
MRIEALKNGQIDDFLKYCKKHRMELDDSYLYDEDLRDFELNDENPTYIVTNQQGDLMGAVSLIIDDYSKRGRKARFRIFHSEIGNLECYSMMMQAVLKHTDGLDKVFLFVPSVNTKLMELIEGLEFTVERYSFVLAREDIEVPESDLPRDYEIRPFKSGRDEEIWCEVRNAGFAKLQGSETPITPEMVRKMMADENHIEGGAMILYHRDWPVGVIRGSDDEYENSAIMDIGPIAIIPEYQGKGLGRSLLRASLRFAKEKSYDRTILCVNADNERAKVLYIQEGFRQVEAVTCYKYDLNTSIFTK